MVTAVASDRTPIPTFNQVHYLQLTWFDLTHATHTTRSHTLSLFLLPLTDCSLRHSLSPLAVCGNWPHSAGFARCFPCSGLWWCCAGSRPHKSRGLGCQFQTSALLPHNDFTPTNPPHPSAASTTSLSFPFTACFNEYCMKQ